MTYYIFLPDDKMEDSVYDTNQLGESSFDSFYPASGLSALMNMVENNPEKLVDITIKKDNGKVITVEEFLTEISKLKVRYNRFS